MEKPDNFSRVDDVVFRSGMITTKEELEFLKDRGITTIVSLHRMPKNIAKIASTMGFRVVPFYVGFAPLGPNINPMAVQSFVGMVKTAREAGGKIVVHCFSGAGRTESFVRRYKTETKLLEDRQKSMRKRTRGVTRRRRL